MRKNLLATGMYACVFASIYFSCSKGGDDGGTNYNPPANPCTGVTISVTANVTGANAGQSNGSITVSANGGTGFTYKLGSGAYQSSATFNNLAAGSYTITAKNSNGCEGSASLTVTTENACNGVAITINNVASSSAPCGNPNGTIAVSASGSTGLTYSVNGTNFQQGNVFSGLATGNYTVTVKDANGCTQTASAAVGTATAGTLFTAVKQVIQNNCVSCHSGAAPAAGRDWSVDCNVVANGALIKTRAVDQAGTAS